MFGSAGDKSWGCGSTLQGPAVSRAPCGAKSMIATRAGAVDDGLGGMAGDAEEGHDDPFCDGGVRSPEGAAIRQPRATPWV